MVAGTTQGMVLFRVALVSSLLVAVCVTASGPVQPRIKRAVSLGSIRKTPALGAVKDKVAPLTDDSALHLPSYLTFLTDAAKDTMKSMNKNFGYHDTDHAETVGRGAYAMTLDLLGASVGRDVARVAYICGLLHDVGYELATKANGYQLLQDPNFDWRKNFREPKEIRAVHTAPGHPKPNAQHEEYSLFVAMKNINLLHDQRREIFVEHITAELVGQFWGGILVTKMGQAPGGGPFRSEKAFEALAKGVTTDDGFDPKATGFTAEMEKLYLRVPGLLGKLTGREEKTTLKGKEQARTAAEHKADGAFLTKFRAAIRMKLPEPNDKDTMTAVIVAMRAADFWFTVQPNAVCISENCRIEFSTYGGPAANLFNYPVDKKSIFDPVALIDFFWAGQKFFMEKIVWAENPILFKHGREAAGMANLAITEKVLHCVRKLTESNWATAYPDCFKDFCIDSPERVSGMKSPSPANPAKHASEWEKYYAHKWLPLSKMDMSVYGPKGGAGGAAAEQQKQEQKPVAKQQQQQQHAPAPLAVRAGDKPLSPGPYPRVPSATSLSSSGGLRLSGSFGGAEKSPKLTEMFTDD